MPDGPTTDQAESTRQSIAGESAQELKEAGHRNINRVWEYTQAGIAIAITCAMIYCEVNEIKADNVGKAFMLIIALYFVRTNHTKSSGTNEHR